MEEEKEIQEETTAPEPAPAEAESEYHEPIYPGENISAAYTALLSVDGIDTGLMEDKRGYDEKITQIRQWCIDIIYENIKFVKDYQTPDGSTE